jgi:hypothetical protein
MKKFFSSMFSGSPAVSSKRFAALFTLLNIIILAYISTFNSTDQITPEFIYTSLSLIVVGGLGLGVVEKIMAARIENKNKTAEEPLIEEPLIEEPLIEELLIEEPLMDDVDNVEITETRSKKYNKKI